MMYLSETVYSDMEANVVQAAPSQAQGMDEELRFLALAQTRVHRALGVGLSLLTAEMLKVLGKRRVDYVRERLGISYSLACDLARIESQLGQYPETDRQWTDGHISISHVREILRCVPSADEFLWARLATTMTVRRFKDELMAAGLLVDSKREESDRDPAADVVMEFDATPMLRAKFELAREIASRMTESSLTPEEFLDVCMMEFHAGRALDRLDQVDEDGVLGSRAWSKECRKQLEDLRARNERELERETDRWSFLSWKNPEAAALPDLSMPGDGDAFVLDERLRAVVAFGQELNSLLMRALWRANARRIELGLRFASIEHYAIERLGMSETTLRGCLRLQRNLLGQPAVRDAYRDGVLTRSQAELVCRIATDETAESWIDYAAGMTVRALSKVVTSGLAYRAERPAERVHLLPPLVANTRSEKALRFLEASFARVPAAGGLRTSGVAAPAHDRQPIEECSHVDVFSRLSGQGCPPPGGVQYDLEQPTSGFKPQENDPNSLEAPLTVTSGAGDHEVPTSGSEQPPTAPDAELPRVPGEPLLYAAETVTRMKFRLSEDIHDFIDRGLGLCRAWLGAVASLAECVELVVDEFLLEYLEMAKKAAQDHPIMERDGWMCSVPGCTNRVNLQGHHIEKKSEGGSDDDINLSTLCAFHHLQCLHQGHIEAKGEAPDDIAWVLGVRPDGSPTEILLGDRILYSRG